MTLGGRTSTAGARNLIEYFGLDDLNAAAAALGLAHTHMAHVFGCEASSMNETTPEDLARLNLALANLPAPVLALLDPYLPGAGGDPDLLRARLRTIAGEEAASLGVSATVRDAFLARLSVRYASGRVSLPAMSRFAFIVGGSASIPTCTMGRSSDRLFAFSLAVDETALACSAETEYWAARAEPLRAAIRAALGGFSACTL
jgi:hypothetical protein